MTFPARHLYPKPSTRSFGAAEPRTGSNLARALPSPRLDGLRSCRPQGRPPAVPLSRRIFVSSSARVRRAPVAILSVLAVLAAGLVAAAPAQAASPDLVVSQVFIGEIHYDNVGTDSGEAVEIAAAGSSRPVGLEPRPVQRQHSDGGRNLHIPRGSQWPGVVPDSCSGWGFAPLSTDAVDGRRTAETTVWPWWDTPGLRLYSYLSYDGVFTHPTEPPRGMTSTDIGVAERARPRSATPCSRPAVLADGPQ